MQGRMDLKHRLILTAMIGLGGGTWAAALGFGIVVIAAVTVGAALPVWLMSRTSLLEPNRRAKAPASILDELEAQQSQRTIRESGPGESYVLTRARPVTLFGRRNDHQHAGR